MRTTRAVVAIAILTVLGSGRLAAQMTAPSSSTSDQVITVSTMAGLPSISIAIEPQLTQVSTNSVQNGHGKGGGPPVGDPPGGSIRPIATPEPTTIMMLSSGLLGLAGFVGRRKKSEE